MGWNRAAEKLPKSWSRAAEKLPTLPKTHDGACDPSRRTGGNERCGTSWRTEHAKYVGGVGTDWLSGWLADTLFDGEVPSYPVPEVCVVLGPGPSYPLPVLCDVLGSWPNNIVEACGTPAQSETMEVEAHQPDQLDEAAKPQSTQPHSSVDRPHTMRAHEKPMLDTSRRKMRRGCCCCSRPHTHYRCYFYTRRFKAEIEPAAQVRRRRSTIAFASVSDMIRSRSHGSSVSDAIRSVSDVIRNQVWAAAAAAKKPLPDGRQKCSTC